MESADARGRSRLLRPLLFLSGLSALGLAGFGLWKLLTRFGRSALLHVVFRLVAIT
jgi:hypothetical protein